MEATEVKEVCVMHFFYSGITQILFFLLFLKDRQTVEETCEEVETTSDY